ncbi:MAG: hypothetical protein J3Q66DRAFT_124736 [Benniella sp.]|nr:MAG: hypothetical protein J3Q66DRAFT_124736 [Benniella sp.]
MLGYVPAKIYAALTLYDNSWGTRQVLRALLSLAVMLSCHTCHYANTDLLFPVHASSATLHGCKTMSPQSLGHRSSLLASSMILVDTLNTRLCQKTHPHISSLTGWWSGRWCALA